LGIISFCDSGKYLNDKKSYLHTTMMKRMVSQRRTFY